MTNSSIKFRERQNIDVIMTSENRICISMVGTSKDDGSVLGPYQEGCGHDGRDCYDTYMTDRSMKYNEYSICMEIEDDGEECFIKWQTHKILDNPNGPSGSEFPMFGRNVSICDDYFVTGSHGQTTMSGEAYIYQNSTMTLKHTLINPDIAGDPDYDYFGQYLAISSIYCAVCAPRNHVKAGTVYIYDTVSGELLHTLESPVNNLSSANNGFGSSVDISNNYCVLGVPNAEGDIINGYAVESVGKAFIYDNITGDILHSLDNPNTQDKWHDRFGFSVAISDTYCVIGAPYGTASSGEDEGLLWVFNTVTGELMHTVEYPGSELPHLFGRYIAIHDDYCITNLDRSDSEGYLPSAAYVFNLLTGDTVQIIPDLLDSVNAVDICGNYCILGQDDYTADGDTHVVGRAYIYSTDTWIFKKELNSPTPDKDPLNSSANFGSSVCINDDYCVIGSWGLDYVTAVYRCTALNPIGCIDPENPLLVDNPDSVPFDFQTAAISEEYFIGVGSYVKNIDDGGGGVINVDARHVFIFTVADGELLHVLVDPNLANRNSAWGRNVAMCDDFCLIADISSEYIVGNGGRVHIFKNSTGELLQTIENLNTIGSYIIDEFGNQIAMCNSYFVVASLFIDNGLMNNAGGAYLFDNNTGDLIHKINNPNPEEGRYFGWGIAVCELLTVVSGLEPSPIVNEDCRVYIFNNATGELLHTLDDPDIETTINSTSFGAYQSLAITPDSKYCLIGNINYTSGIATQTGIVYIFDTITGSLIHTLHNPKTNTQGTKFGHMCVTGDTYCAISCYEDDTTYLFDIETGTLLEVIDSPNVGLPSHNYLAISETTKQLLVSCGIDDDDSQNLYIYGKCPIASLEPLHTIDNPAPNETSGHWFGYAVAISESYSIVSAPNQGDLDYNGGCHIFSNNTGELLHTLENPSNYGNYPEYGYSVDISESYCIVGAPSQDVGTDENVGIAYIFDTTTGALLYTLENPSLISPAEDDHFGRCVAIDGSYCIVGADGDGKWYGDESGSVFIFNSSTGELIHKISDPNAAPNSHHFFGKAVDIHGIYCIVGAFGSNKAYIFSIISGELIYTLEPPNELESNYFGGYVAISDNYCIVGDDLADNGTTIEVGKAYIYDIVSGELIHTLVNPNNSTDDLFGGAVTINKQYCMVGASRVDNNTGKAYIYDIVSGELLTTFENPNDYGTPENDEFGFSVSLSESFGLVGARYEDDELGTKAGKAYIYNID